MTAYIPLNEHAIRSQLTHSLNQALNLQILASVDSTHRFLKHQNLQPGLTLCVAETQTHGRGRFARPWHSPLGENIYCSLVWRFAGRPSKLSGLSLVISLAVHAAIQELIQEQSLDHADPHITIKWPNDVLWDNKKLAGILIELAGEGRNNTHVIISIGLNVNASTDKNTPIDQPWCALRDIVKQHVDRNTLLARLITQLDQHLQGFSKYGFEAYQAQWQALDYLLGRSITVSTSQGTRTGQAHGVDIAGHLQLIDEHGVTHTLLSGDASLAQKSS